MAFIPREVEEGTAIGSRIRINHDVRVMKGTFTGGTEFTVIGKGPRGLDLIDDQGNQLLEVHPALVNFERV